jgi:signal transduction histidine kinase
VNAVTRAQCPRARHRAEKKIRLVIRLDCQAAQALCERERIQQVLHNLVGNAIHYTPDGRDVVVRVWKGGDEMFVSVADGGLASPPSSSRSCSTATGGAGAPRATASASASSSSTG